MVDFNLGHEGFLGEDAGRLLGAGCTSSLLIPPFSLLCNSSLLALGNNTAFLAVQVIEFLNGSCRASKESGSFDICSMGWYSLRISKCICSTAVYGASVLSLGLVSIEISVEASASPGVVSVRD